jgi:hypothetical protein
MAKNKTPPRKRGRPSAYKEAFAAQAVKLCKLGATNADLADFFEVNVRTIERWSVENEEFCRSLKVGKEEADNRVEASLYHRAVGYTFDAVKIMAVSLGNNAGAEVRRIKYREHVAPDTTAAIFWLKNRRPEEWREKVHNEHTGADGAALIPIINLTVGGGSAT